MSVPTAKNLSLLDDDIWVMMMAAYWRIISAIDRKVREETEGLPDFLAADIEKEIRATAYAEEQRIWSAGMDRLCELYGVPEGPSTAPMAQQSLMEPEARCKSCGAAIWWGVSSKGTPVPMSVATGVSHFADCPDAKKWSKGTKRVPA
jgi:hypothetical protein